MMQSRKFAHAALLLTSFTIASSGAHAASETVKGDYVVTYLGLTVARSSMVSRVDGNSYTIDGSVATAGLGKIFDDTKATLQVRGAVSKSGVAPATAFSDYRHEKKPKKLTIRFAKGNVTATEMDPPPKPRAADWVVVSDAQLKGVIDPISAFLVKADSFDTVCNQSMKLYDGEMRFDLQLTPKAIEDFKIDGYTGKGATCTVKFSPVAGYRANKKSIKFMRDKSRMTITFAPLGTTGIYAPIRATVGTEIGTLTLSARKVEMTE
jgi:hypothetical protein